MKQQEMVLKAIELEEVNYDSWDYNHFGEVECITHDVKIESDDLIQVAYPQFDELVKLQSELEDEKVHAEESELDEWGNSKRYYELLDEVQAWLEGEVNDIFDYDAEPIILVNGQIL